ncbi:transcriptional regulator (plasmid) [Deinococcus metallilatus]|nr:MULTISPECIES: metal-sensitive transcriptional regulator [Deinococcus]MBB5293629.1 DNA-binding FrmR family transcriptional regulator [Deinococcus metallilatus]QBY07390.1 transcriptional regulator [Deinococcus metallilatus]RXJ14863.1 transcriptional regulator [Deinococcus metallilatus]TLK30984.1 metal-sensitive transcriptional regulator [Deinococcus metallilatus]
MTAPVPVSDREAEKTKILNRLRRLEGQIRGLQRMVEEEKNCVEVMTLYASAKSAFESTGDVILETYVEVCRARGVEPAELVRLLRLAR